ncbi:MAG TPA: hypothetical protein VHZ24_22910 [Pirellulales bacterium]|nr:hypothetical protein [Pirellulales bacterium]
MARNRLRIYHGPEKLAAPAHEAAPRTISVRLGEVLPLLADAVNSNRTWLRDFKNDEVTISTDLYEVILAYQHCRRPVA